MSTETPRTLRLRTLLRISQMEMAERLGVSQSTVDRMEKGQAESGPVSILLGLIERDIAAMPRPSSVPRPDAEGAVALAS